MRVRGRPAQPRLLHDVLGVGDLADDPVRDAEQDRPMLGESSAGLRAVWSPA